MDLCLKITVQCALETQVSGCKFDVIAQTSLSLPPTPTPQKRNISLIVPHLGVVIGKCKTLRDGETSIFLYKPQTF